MRAAPLESPKIRASLSTPLGAPAHSFRTCREDRGVSGSLALFARTFVIGVAVAAPVGATGVLCIQRTLAHGWRAGMSTGAGIATADGTYAALAAFGVAAVGRTGSSRCRCRCASWAGSCSFGLGGARS